MVKCSPELAHFQIVPKTNEECSFYLHLATCSRRVIALRQQSHCATTAGTFIAVNYKFFYRPKRSFGQGNVFTGVCLSTGGGGCLPQCMLGCHTPPPDLADLPGSDTITPPDLADPPDQIPPPRPGRPPRIRHHTPPDQTPPPPDLADPPSPPGSDTTPHPPPGSRLQHTVYERPVRFLLECILVTIFPYSMIPSIIW